MKYSIVTPNYNGYSLMDNYFKAFEKQTLKDFEIIIVDDCSTDDSFEMIKRRVADSELNIKVLKAEVNSGPGNARNIGIDAADGEWITFVDNDDWVTLDFLENIDKVIADTDVNCVIYDFYIKTTDGEKPARSMYYGQEGKITLSQALRYTRNHSIGKFYKLDSIRQAGVRFPTIRRCEDVSFTFKALAACRTVYYHKVPLYYYFQRRESLSNNKSMSESAMVEAFTIIENGFDDTYHDEISEKSVTDLLYGGLLMMCMAGKGRKYIVDYIKAYEKKYPRWHKYPILKYVGKAKKIFLICARFKLVLLLKLMTKLHSKLVG